MSDIFDDPHDLAALGWSEFFAAQLAPGEGYLTPVRIASVHRSRLVVRTTGGQVTLDAPPQAGTRDFAVGDWALSDPEAGAVARRLDRKTVLRRRTEDRAGRQLIAANVDTLFIVTSCNDDFNPARLERYLAVVNEAGAEPVIVLTKIDAVADPEPWLRQALALQRDLQVLTLNAKDPAAAQVLAPWCGPGRTVALIGSSGVGKSTLLNTLAGKSGDGAQATGGIRESDAKGRHTTTARSLHATAMGGWVIDTPGMRTLHVSEAAGGLQTLFAEIAELAPRCRFRDCTHAHEPGCAVLAAVADGRLSADRLERWRKLDQENRANTPATTGPRGRRGPRR
ncbi:ribosome small subunit-dependent GTPase A [Paracoccus rhizosphaerae]|uniref:Small ribosomal subunit biogenesis GTPase RsgA n=1 Tax=Paracoccus rhizosphaerae TaxID=1133347 RepID=A0ABV6CQ21_9RHOB|nr:ribosome small subunit-dependent GTPase A [Paracoccus rhizosphaerae]